MSGSDQDQDETTQELLDRLLELIGMARTNQKPLTAFAGVRGERATGALTVVGQAPYGWSESWSPKEVRDESKRRAILKALEAKSSMKWLTEPGKQSGQFWSHVRDIGTNLGDFDSGDDRWPVRINWTNLYKVAPDRGNPSPQLRAMQQALCVQILWRELFRWRPERVLFLTGLPWAAPFILAHREATLTRRTSGYVQATGHLSIRGAGDVKVVVAQHPARKKGSRERRVQQVVEAFEDLG